MTYFIIYTIANVVFFIQVCFQQSTEEGSKKAQISFDMSTVVKVEVFAAAMMSLCVCSIIFFYAANEEILIKRANNYQNYFFVYMFYNISILVLHASVTYFLSIVRNLQFQVGQRNRKSENNIIYSLYRSYRAHCSFRNGNLFIYKIQISEFCELFIQVLAFDELSKSANLFYMLSSSILIFLNMTISPLLLMFRHKIKKAKYASKIIMIL